MPIEQALTPDDVAAMQLQAVPDLWPPAECSPAGWPAAGLTFSQPTGMADPGNGADAGPPWPRQFAVLLAEALTGDRPVRQIRPWLSPRGSVHLHRLLPLFGDGQRARVHRVLTTHPTPDVIEMTLVVAVGPRIRALAVRLALATPQKRPVGVPATRTATSPRWLCTDIEAA